MSDLQQRVAEVLGYTVKPAITKGWYQLLLNDAPIEGALSKRPDGLLPYVPMFDTDLNAAWQLLTTMQQQHFVSDFFMLRIAALPAQDAAAAICKRFVEWKELE